MDDPAPQRLAEMTGDLERFAAGFLEVLDRLGPEAAARHLGGLTEWCGSDLTSGIFLLPLPLWHRVDALAAELQAACAETLAAGRDDPTWPGRVARVRAAAGAAAALRREVEGAGRSPAS